MQEPPGLPPRVSRLVVLVVLFSAFTVVLKLPSLTFAHDEPDEVIYWSVARNLVEHGTYTLRGAPIQSHLSPTIYDRPLFHHPPLYPLLLMPFVALDAPQAAVVISWLGHLLCVMSIGIIAWAISRGGGDERADDSAWLALLGVATDPLLAHVSRKLWIDALLSGLVALALALVWAARVSRRRRLLLLLGGFVLGLAGLAKLPGLLAAPLAVMLLWNGESSRRERVRDLLLLLAPCALLVLPWLAVFVSTYGVLTPNWLRPDDDALRHYPFLAISVGRPWYYYAAKLAVVQPVAMVGLALYPRQPRGSGLSRWVVPAWLLIWLSVSTLQGVGGYGFQMRYVAPLVPSLYAMLLYARTGRYSKPVIALAITYGAIGSAPYLIAGQLDELISFAEFAGLVRF
jgi:4-amino-4-deoxy-L-arabinose transferase-like glycosyltransferase